MPDVAALQPTRPAGQPGRAAAPGGHIGVVPRRHRRCWSPRRCGRMTWLAWAGFFPVKPAMSWWPTADSARSLIWAADSELHAYSPAPEADRRLHAGPCPCPARSEAGTQGDARSRWVSACGLMDQVVEYQPCGARVDEPDEYRKLPESIMVRELRFGSGAGVPTE